MACTLTHSDGSSLVFPGEEWPYVLQLLEQYGWDPVGTISPRLDGSWDGTYLVARGQMVSVQDATAMASALESALPEIAEEDAGATSPTASSPDRKSDDPRSALSRALRRTDPREVLKGPAKQRLRAFIEFARSGEFRIG
jgi:hypothetical protein